ncbi:MAG: DUF4292 domain-containing protein [Prevotella sp.]|jgi:hypothetical protein
MMRSLKSYIPFVAVSLLLAFTSCGTQKQAVGNSTTVSKSTTETNSAVRKLQFVQKVSDNQLYQKNIVASMTFSLESGDKDISVPGQLRLRKDQVIRIQLQMPLLGSEVGRLEFTPTYVLVIDRIHKQYVKADYNQLDFLRDNGLNFYSLQAMFWNQLLLPGAQKVSESDLKKFDVDLSSTQASTYPISLQNGNISYVWTADKSTGHILKALITYANKQNSKSTLTWNYSDFRSMGSKKYPANQSFSFKTNALKKHNSATVTLEMNKLSNDDNWEAQTTVSSKYKQVDPQDIMKKLLSM